MMKSQCYALLAGTLCAGACLAGQPLEVSLAGVQHDRGAIRVGLYADPKTFRKEAQAFAVLQTPAEQGTVAVRFDDVPPGRYAIMAYHDEDGNGELSRRFGMFPSEGYGLSNNPQVMGPPAFEDSAFEIADAPQTVRIDLRY